MQLSNEFKTSDSEVVYENALFSAESFQKYSLFYHTRDITQKRVMTGGWGSSPSLSA